MHHPHTGGDSHDLKYHTESITPLAGDPVLKEIAQAAAQVADTSVGFVTLLDDAYLWIIARFGSELEHSPREAAFCAYAVHNANVMWVEDATRDQRFEDHPLVLADPNIRFYAGAPLSNDEGLRVGTVCVFDDKPRPYAADVAEQLQMLAARASEHLGPRVKVVP